MQSFGSRRSRTSLIMQDFTDAKFGTSDATHLCESAKRNFRNDRHHVEEKLNFARQPLQRNEARAAPDDSRQQQSLS
jgi:hypothetical protein